MVPFGVPYDIWCRVLLVGATLELFSLRGSAVCAQITISHEARPCQGSHVKSPSSQSLCSPPHLPVSCLSSITLASHLEKIIKKKQKTKNWPRQETREHLTLSFICVNNANAEGEPSNVQTERLLTRLWIGFGHNHTYPFPAWICEIKAGALGNVSSEVRRMWTERKELLLLKAHPHTKPSKFRAGFVCKKYSDSSKKKKKYSRLRFLSKSKMKYFKMKTLSAAIRLLWRLRLC